jgi:NAD(P)-dependent dehydrogenase (short-subunit alcohol dehydrogenase family)
MSHVSVGRLAGKVARMAGASRGIGNVIAERYPSGE